MAKETTKAGDLDRSITIQRATTTYNEFNEPIATSWIDLLTDWRAKREDVSDRQRLELMAAGQIGSFLATHFTVRHSSETAGITASDRIIHEGDVWEIKAPPKEAVKQGRFRFLEILAVKDADI